LQKILPWLVVLLMGLAMTACGGGADVENAGAGKNTITVTATAGSQTASAQITLIVS
jgi:ABC-type glycerol-3-phosphate transport system substrate-binding protein